MSLAGDVGGYTCFIFQQKPTSPHDTRNKKSTSNCAYLISNQYSITYICNVVAAAVVVDDVAVVYLLFFVGPEWEYLLRQRDRVHSSCCCCCYYRKASSYAVGLGGSKRLISDPLFIRRDLSRYLPYRQLDRVCSFLNFICALSGGV